jgi:hypothetical protein
VVHILKTADIELFGFAALAGRASDVIDFMGFSGRWHLEVSPAGMADKFKRWRSNFISICGG